MAIDLAQVANKAVDQSLDGDELNGEVDVAAVSTYEDGDITVLDGDGSDVNADSAHVGYSYCNEHGIIIKLGVLTTEVGKHGQDVVAQDSHTEGLGKDLKAIAQNVLQHDAMHAINKDGIVLVKGPEGDDNGLVVKAHKQVQVDLVEVGKKAAGITDKLVNPVKGNRSVEIQSGMSNVDVVSELVKKMLAGEKVLTGPANLGGSCIDNSDSDGDKQTITKEVHSTPLPGNDNSAAISIGKQSKDASVQQRQTKDGKLNAACSGTLLNAIPAHMSAEDVNIKVLAVIALDAPADGKQTKDIDIAMAVGNLPSSVGGDGPIGPVVQGQLQSIGMADA